MLLKYAENLKETNLVYAENLNTYLSFARLTEFAIFSIIGLVDFLLEESDYREILQYLSEEAKLLILHKGSRDSYPRSSWYMGRRIGTVSTNEGDTIFLMEQDTTLVLPKQKRGRSRDVKLLTCTRKDGQYFPLLGFKTTKGKTSSVGYNIYPSALQLFSLVFLRKIIFFKSFGI